LTHPFSVKDGERDTGLGGKERFLLTSKAKLLYRSYGEFKGEPTGKSFLFLFLVQVLPAKDLNEE
jgi:hypothetical protein